MEHAAKASDLQTSALFSYPIKSLVYAGALKFVITNKEKHSGQFTPLDSKFSETNDTDKYPPLFVILVKGADPTSIECHVFVVEKKRLVKQLLKSCRKAFDMNSQSISEFTETHGGIPAAFSMDDETPVKVTDRQGIRVPDANGFFYALESTPVDLWQLFETSDNDNDCSSIEPYSAANSNVQWKASKNDLIDKAKRSDFDIKELLQRDELSEENFSVDPPTILIRQQPDPPPIIFEKYIRKKQPQIIIKEIYVIEPACPPIKYVNKYEGTFKMPEKYIMY